MAGARASGRPTAARLAAVAGLAWALLASAAPAVAQPSDPAAAEPDTALVNAAEFADYADRLQDFSCSGLDSFAYVNAPALVVAGRPDLLYDLVAYWGDGCAETEPLVRTRLLGAIWDGAFNEGLYGPEIVDWLDLWLEAQTDPGLPPVRRSYDAFTVSFADQMLPHMPDGGLEQFLCLFYSNRADEAWALLDDDALADTWLRFYHDDAQAYTELTEETVIFGATSGVWLPDAGYELPGDHALLGLIVERHRRGRFVRFAFDMRLGRTTRPYQVVQDDVDARSDRFDAVYLGLEGGVSVLRYGNLDANLFAAVGVDVVRPFQNEEIYLNTINVGVGAGARWRVWSGRPWVALVDVRREWLGERNENVDSLSARAFSVRAGVGWAWGWSLGGAD